MNTAEELTALRAEIAELRRQLDQVRSAFRFHDGKLVELCMRQARVQYLNFGPPDNPDTDYGWIHTSEGGASMLFADGENLHAFQLKTGKHAGEHGVRMEMEKDGTVLNLRPGMVIADTYVIDDDCRKITAEASFGIHKGVATLGLFGPGKDSIVTLKALPDGGVMQCKSPGDKASVFIHARDNTPMVILKDGQGRDLVQLVPTRTGGAVIIHGGESGKPVVTLAAGEDGSMVELRSFDDESRVTLQAREKTSDLFIRRPGQPKDGCFIRAQGDGTTLNLVQEGKSLVHLGYRWIGMDMILAPALGGGKIGGGPIAFGGALHLSTTDNRTLIFSPVEVQSQIASLSPEGLVQFQLGAPFDAGGRLILYNEIGVERLCFLTDKDNALVQLHHGGTLGLTIAATAQGGALCTLDPEGTITGTVPADFDPGSLGGDAPDAPR